MRRISDGQAYQLDKLEETVAKNLSHILRDLDVRTNDGLTTDAKYEISRAWESLAQEGFVSYPRRGVVKITMKGLEEISRDPERQALSDNNVESRPRAESAARLVGADESETAPTYSPPLSPDEIADVEAIASGDIKLRHVSKSELFRIVSVDTEAEAHAERLASLPPTDRHEES